MNDTANFLSNVQLLEILTHTKTATAVHIGEDAKIQFANDAMINIWGKDRGVIGKSLEEALPELKGQPFIEMFARVWREGLIISGSDTPADLLINGSVQTIYFDFEYRAIKNEKDETICILHTAINVTERYLRQKAQEESVTAKESLAREQKLNEQLAASNEELNASIEELQQTQEQLSLLNNELEERVEARVLSLAESEARFRTMAEGSELLIAIGDESSNAIYFSKSWVELTGKSMENLLQFGWVDLLHPNDKQPFVDIYLNAFAKQQPFTGEFRVRNKQGDYRWLLAKGPPRFRPDGSFAGYISSCVDITDIKDHEHNLLAMTEEMTASNEELVATNEELSITQRTLHSKVDELAEAIHALQESEQKLMIAIETGNMGTWSIDPNTYETSQSYFVRNLLGLPLEGKVELELSMQAIKPEYRELVRNEISTIIATGISTDLEYAIVNLLTGEEKWVKATGRMLTDSKGKPTEYTGMLMDITERKLDELRKNDFIGMVSHELKTPLTSLSAIVQIANTKLKNTEDSFLSNAMERASLQVKRMSTLINGFLNISRLESGKIQMNKNEFDLVALADQNIQESRLTTSNHVISMAASEPILINADADKIGSVISNLLSNAVKYSPDGMHIQVSCRKNSEGIEFSVKDEGMGIAEKDIEHLFDRYYRVETPIHNNISGFGIGLYLSAEIVKQHGGKIWAESTPNEGSIFYFTLPA